MGPMFYLVQCEEARCLISAVLLADWPRESFPRPTSGPCTEPLGHLVTSACAGFPRPQRPAALGKKLGGKFAPSGRCALLLCAARWWIFCEDR